jgi:predicted kinase
MRYSPGSLVVVASASARDRDPFVRRVFEEQNAIFSLEKIRHMLTGRVPEADIEAKSHELLDATVAKRMESGATAVVPVAGLDHAERDRYVRMAHKHRRPRHIIFVESAREDVAEEDRATVNDLRRALDAGELGEEGFQTALRVGGAAIDELKRIVFRSPPRDED